MTDVDTRTRAARTAPPRTPAGAAVAMLVALAAPAACFVPALTALIAGHAGLGAIPRGLALWAFAGFALILAGASLGQHAHLIDWGIALMAATVAGAAAGLPLAAWR